jgi:hypothetical protein
VAGFDLTLPGWFYPTRDNKISGMLFFHPEEVRHCIFGGTLIEVAA